MDTPSLSSLGEQPRPQVAGVVLAAGQSSRLGGPIKQLLPLHGCPLLEHTLQVVNSVAQLAEVIVVLGHEAERIAAEAHLGRARVVYNPDYASGQSTSMQAGLRVLSPDVSAALFVLGDMPGVQPDLVEQVIALYYQTQAPIVLVSYADRDAHPVLIDRSLWAELSAITGDQGARPLLQAHRHEVQRVDARASTAPLDVDTWDDYQRLIDSTPLSPPV